MSEDLTDYLKEIGIKVQYLHSEVKTLERIEIIRDLRLGKYDVLIGINLIKRRIGSSRSSLSRFLMQIKKVSYVQNVRLFKQLVVQHVMQMVKLLCMQIK